MSQDDENDVLRQIKHFEKCIYEGDLAGMAQVIGDLHARWEDIDSEKRADILKLEAIFLSMLQARVRAAPPAQDTGDQKQ